MKHFGIIGFPVGHSESARLFNEKFAAEDINAEYSLYPLEQVSTLRELILRHQLSGLNVTIPHKQAVIPLLDELDETAREVGAVNVIRVEDGRLTGYNTDVIGFRESIRPILLPADRRALVLGTGGASRAVAYGLQQLGVEVTFVSRSAGKGLTYEEIDAEVLSRHTVIVNTTPLGMTPHTEGLPPIPYRLLRPEHLLFDVVYTPAETRFLQEGKRIGCRTQNGIGMLQGQAKAAWEIWQR